MGGGGAGGGGCRGRVEVVREADYVESSGSDLMVFLSLLVDTLCEVPFSVAGVLVSSVLWL